jgi:P-type Mg2+ transporter
MEDKKDNLFEKLSFQETLDTLETSLAGLSSEEVHSRQKKYGLNIIHKRKINLLVILLRQFTGNPLIIILGIATLFSYFLGQHISSYYIFGIIVASVFLGLWNEYSAERTVDNLLKKISPTALAIRNNEKIEIPVADLTIGDIVLLSQGSIAPADIRFTESQNLEMNESVLTGESKTVFKTTEPLKIGPKNISDYKNIGFMGTFVESGSGKGIVIRIGKMTEFGKIAQSTTFVKPITDFQKGLINFGNLIIKVVAIMTIAIFAINALLGHELIESLLFSLAIAVGLTPELLPVIVTVSLSHGAGKLAKKHIVAKQLIAIENLGNMDILCTDKTGTLTEGKISLVNYFNSQGQTDKKILQFALDCNSAILHHKILGNAIDAAIWEYVMKSNFTYTKYKKIEEEPFDYNRKAMYCIVEEKNELQIIVKGAPDNVLGFCNNKINKENFHKMFAGLNSQGLRMVAIASKKIAKKDVYSWADINDLSFEGYLTFLDIPKKSAKESLARLHDLNVQTKIITGDNETITAHICEEIGIPVKGILLGSEIDTLSDEALQKKIMSADIFVRVNPEQKLRIIKSLQKLGHTVGYLGDGINDIPSLRGADVGLSVNMAVDVAKDAAAIVLLHKSLDVIADGIIEGRKTFNNTIKYILMATSSNFGNMFSAAGASFFLPFLPMTPVQILLTNGLYDISQTGIPSDNVDPESLLKPRHWNIDFIKNYMIFFGPLSSVFDFATFGVMLFVFHARDSLFQTGWFIESIATEILIVFVIRTARTPFFLSKPSKWLFTTCTFLTILGIALPFTPLAKPLGFMIPPPGYFIILIFLITAYLFLVETVKSFFLKRFSL